MPFTQALEHVRHIGITAAEITCQDLIRRACSCYTWYRVNRLILPETPISNAVEQFLQSLCHQNLPFAACLFPDGPSLILNLGLPKLGVNNVLIQHFNVKFPGSILETTTLHNSVAEMPSALSFSGLPGLPKKDRNRESRVYPDANQLHNAALGLHWVYFLMAVPGTFRLLETQLLRLQEFKFEFVNTYMRTGTTESSNNPGATRIITALDHGISWRQQAKNKGFWQVIPIIAYQEPVVRSMLPGQFLSLVEGGAHDIAQPIAVDDISAAQTTWMNSEHLSRLLFLPQEAVPGIEVDRRVKFYIGEGFLESNSQMGLSRVALGCLSDIQSLNRWVSIPANNLSRHLFISGMPGSGKTESALFVLKQVWQEQNIPFLVIEPAKTEYRTLALSHGFEDLHVFSATDAGFQMRLNPFYVPAGVRVQMHIDFLRNLFVSSFSGLYPPMPQFLERSLYRAYENKGWNWEDVSDGSSQQVFPVMQDFRDALVDLVQQSGYTGDLRQDLEAALLVRITSLTTGSRGRILNTHLNIPSEVLFRKPVLIELAGVAEPELLAFLMGLLLIRLLEDCAVRMNHSGKDHLRHVTLVEEAHRFFSCSQGKDHPDQSSGREKSMEFFMSALAEIRALGEALIISDQSPGKLAPDIVRLTGHKIVHRTVFEADRSLLAGAMNLSRAQKDRLVSLRTGEAVVFPYGSQGAYLVRFPAIREYLKKSTVSDLMEHMKEMFFGEHPEFLAVSSPKRRTS